MDERTHRYYDEHAAEIVGRYSAVDDLVHRHIDLAFEPGARILDVGAGSGRDLSHLLASGRDAYGVEPSDSLRHFVLEKYPELVGRLERGQIPDLGRPFGGQFDGVLCSAVLMHLPREMLFDAALALRSVLKPSGRLLLSVPAERPGLNSENRDSHGRLFTPLDPDYLTLLFERLGFALVTRWLSEDVMGCQGLRGVCDCDLDAWRAAGSVLRHPERQAWLRGLAAHTRHAGRRD
jgi:SAM-dependent methyltransferase